MGNLITYKSGIWWHIATFIFIHSFSIKSTFYDKMGLRLFYFDVAICFQYNILCLYRVCITSLFIFYCEPWKRLCVDSKRTLSLTLKRILLMKNRKATVTVTPIENSINEDPQDLQDPHWLLRRELTLFGFLVMVYDRVGDGDKISKENFDLGRPRFHVTSHLKIEAEVFFS